MITSCHEHGTFSALLALCEGNPTVGGTSNTEISFLHAMNTHAFHIRPFVGGQAVGVFPLTKDQYCRALMFTLWLGWTSCWTNSGMAMVWGVSSLTGRIIFFVKCWFTVKCRQSIQGNFPAWNSNTFTDFSSTHCAKENDFEGDLSNLNLAYIYHL